MDIDLNKTKLSIEILSKKLNWMSKFERTRIFQQNYTSEINLAAPKSYQSDIKRRILFYNSKEKILFYHAIFMEKIVKIFL